MSGLIHPSAIVDPNARLADSVSVGPYSVIGADVEVGENSWIGPHVVINGPTRIGRNNKIYQFSSLGEAPQDKKYDNEPTTLTIGDNNVIREFVTINRGTAQDIGNTTVGNDNWVMAYVHIAHDCTVGSNNIFANSSSLAGHVIIEDYVILGGFTLVHQFCSVGAHSFTAMNSVISKDVPPYFMVSGHMAKPHGLNSTGLKRRGFSQQALADMRKAYKILYRSGFTLEKALKELAPLAQQTPEVDNMKRFIEKSRRGIVR